MRCFRSLALPIFALFLAGCDTRAVSTPKTVGKALVNATTEDVLTSAIYQLRPENLFINSSVDKPVSLLNSWRIKQAEADGAAEKSMPVDAPAGWVPQEQEARLSQTKFDVQDAFHIRDALFFRDVAGYLSDRGGTEIKRVEVVVDFVCRNISLWKDDDIQLPLTPFICMQVGRGTADDRALIIAEILQQLKIDSMIIRAQSDSTEATDKWLFGVVIDKKIRLFDLHNGMTVASSAGANSPASLDEIVAQPDLLEQMSTKDRYRLTADDLKDPTVSVISTPNAWCLRLRRLEQVLPAEDVCVIYQPLSDEGGKTGLLKRIALSGNWPVEKVKLWQYPLRQEEKSRQLTQVAAEEMKNLTLPFILPIPIETSSDGKVTQRAPERKFLTYRMDQLLGKFAQATQRYLSIRHLEIDKYPAEIDRLNRIAAENAFYWTAVCKVELEDYPAAAGLLKEYVKKYDRKGKWFFSARSLLAQCYAQIGDINEAISTLERSSSEDPYQAGNAIRLKRWNAIRTNTPKN